MTKNRYKFDFSRLVNLWLLPVLFIVITLVFIFSKYNSFEDLSAKDILGLTFFFLFSAGAFIILFFNHLPIAKKTELIITNNTLEITQGDDKYSCNLAEIEEVVEYSTGRLPWSSIAKWIIKVNDREFVISSLTISKLNFERHFWNHTKDKTSLFPTL